MPFQPTGYKVFIASPNDLPEERIAATTAVNEWNDLHSTAEDVVLLPVKWETHATPEAGIRGQAVINRELVEPCDILIGMFWTKIGTDAGLAKTGTVEEIEQFVTAGKPAMLYFSKRPIDPSKIDVKQFQSLTEFKEETYKNALCGTFADLQTLGKTLHKDLTNTVRRMKRVALQAGLSTRASEEAAVQAGKVRSEFERQVLAESFETFKSFRTTLALSIIPANPLKTPIDYSPTQEQKIRPMIVPIRGDFGTWVPLGKHVYSEYPRDREYQPSAPPPQGATKLTDRGSIFAVDNWLWQDNDTTRVPKFRMRVYQPKTTIAAKRYLEGLRTLGVKGPLFVGISILKAGKFQLRPTDENDDFSFPKRGNLGADIITDTIEVPEGRDVSTFESVAEILAPAFLHIWREAGWQHVPKYDEHGNLLTSQY